MVVPTLTDDELDDLELMAQDDLPGSQVNINPAAVLRAILELRHLRAVDDEPTGDALTPSEARGYNFGRRNGFTAGRKAALLEAATLIENSAGINSAPYADMLREMANGTQDPNND